MDIWSGKSQHKSSEKFVIGLRQENILFKVHVKNTLP